VRAFAALFSEIEGVFDSQCVDLDRNPKRSQGRFLLYQDGTTSAFYIVATGEAISIPIAGGDIKVQTV
jgi:hypothetical protein